MPIYTASLFEPDHHHGRLVQICSSLPKGFECHAKLPFLAPPKDLHGDWEDWKRSHKINLTTIGKKFPLEEHIAEYKERYKAHVKQNWQAIADHVASLKSWETETWLCWEKAGEFCHRNLALDVVQKFWPEHYGGADVPMAIASPGLHYWFTEVAPAPRPQKTPF